MLSDTIAAISTALGEAAISVIRLSGPQALPIASRAFKLPEKVIPRRAHVVSVRDEHGAALDSGVLLHFQGPASYTGEDIVEFHGHGGVLVTQRVLERLLACGARAAEPGEFTQRAFLNGKMDLTQAEAVMDLIHAQSTLALRAANEQLGGAIGREAAAMQQALVPVLAHIEAYIDFPEEDISPETGADLLRRIDAVQEQARQLLATSEQGRILRHGARTVISGAPNVGKSSLLNVLLGFERAIVSPTAGTTRDTIEEIIQVHGIPLRLVDTAGLREASDDIERIGIERTQRELERADLILEVLDATSSAEEVKRLDLPPALAPRRLVILNKADLGVHPSWDAESAAIRVSCLKNTGITALRDAIRDVIARAGPLESDHPVAINARHQAAFQRSVERLAAARAAIESQQAPEFIALELRESLQALGDVIGQVDVEQILDVIFSTFCIGK
ncbi:MAG: tRNA uridine-5-carboxymethylaminomethyl(34) synthesis GTPase MnmE [Verrucomicrobiaceae bacterium]|nr:tRNA uridine-5-carboxymethylaminomethyl(34) synthesis GTPase MnmE [Verrucomicrobiaceae bacterium]